MPWSEEEDVLLAERFGNGSKITELARIHSRTYGAIKARLIKLGLLQKQQEALSKFKITIRKQNLILIGL